MNNFLLLPYIVLLSLLPIIAAACVAQMCSCIVCGISMGVKKLRSEPLFYCEAAMMTCITAAAAMYALTVISYQQGLPLGIRLVVARYAVCVLCLICAAAAAAGRRSVLCALCLPAALIFLPACEKLCGSYYPYLFISAAVLSLVRSVLMLLSRHRAIAGGITAISLKEAMDGVTQGILFCDPVTGYIFFVNRRMRELMFLLCGGEMRSGLVWYDFLRSGDPGPDCRRLSAGDSPVFRLPGGNTESFTAVTVDVSGKKCLRITAADVTALWSAVERLKEENELLEERGERIKAALANIEEQSRRRETIRIKNRAHDVLGQRLTVLQRVLDSPDPPDPAVMSSLADGLLEQLHSETARPGPAQELDSQIDMFARVGVTVKVSGSLPSGEETAFVFVKIIREAATNAVRHAGASLIDVSIVTGGGRSVMKIRNNGIPPSGGPVKEGGGISGMRRRLADIGGSLEISVSDGFEITVIAEDRNDKGTDS